MIFVTVGTQLPFDRLVRAVDAWAQAEQRGDVFAQIGPTDFRPGALSWKNQLEPGEFKEKMESADLIIAHAGMGTIINALRMHKTLLVMPRHAEKGEHRNDHQIATVRELAARGLIHTVPDEHALADAIARVGSLPPLPPLPEFAQDRLIGYVHRFIAEAGA